MSGPPGAQELAGILTLDSNGELILTDAARRNFIKRVKESLQTGQISDYPMIPAVDVIQQDKEIDLEDKEKYADFHKIWVDGYYLSVAKSLNVPQNFAIPVFDPVALGKSLNIDSSKITYEASVAVMSSPASTLLLLGVKPKELPAKLAAAAQLIKPQPPAAKDMAYLSTLKKLTSPDKKPRSFAPYGATHVTQALDEGLKKGLATAYAATANPAYWASHNFKTSDQVHAAAIAHHMSKPFNPSEAAKQQASAGKSPGSTGRALGNALAVAATDCASFATTASTVGGGAVLQKQAESKSYLTPKVQGVPSLVSEAAQCKLVPFQPEPNSGVTWPMYKSTRNTYFADPFTANYLIDAGEHMKNLAKSGVVNPGYVLEVGNICGKDLDIPTKHGVIKGNGWRWSKWSADSKAGKPRTGHPGSSFDFAYPMKDPKTGASVTGFDPKSPVYLGDSEEDPRGTPYRCQGTPDNAMPSAWYDFNALYELLSWSCTYWQNIIDEGRIRSEPRVKKEFIKNYKPDIIVAVIIGITIHGYFQTWCNTNKAKDKNLLRVLGLFAPQKGHEDHLHFRVRRTHIDDEAMAKNPGKMYYYIPWEIENQYGQGLPGTARKHVLVDNPAGGPQIEVYI